MSICINGGVFTSKINIIQNKIKEMDGGSFQKLFDAYLFKKYKFNNIQPLGVQDGTNKTTKGTPDTFVIDEDRKYILIMYGTVKTSGFKKMKNDLLDCLSRDKLTIDRSRIKKIILGYSSTNIHPEQIEELQRDAGDIELETIGIDTISHDLLVNYPSLAKDYLGIQIDTHQIFSIDEFIKAYDKNGTNAPLNIKMHYREREKKELYEMISSSPVTIVTGGAGVGKTRLVLEVCKQFENEGRKVLCIKNNGESLCSDLSFYISDAGKYILFIDDANQTTSLDYIMDYTNAFQSDFDIEIKIVMTVRDYAISRLRSVVCKYVKMPPEMAIKPLKDDEIRGILNDNLEISDEVYLQKLLQIAKGNPRLAILAGKTAVDYGYFAIRDATDIFAQYYGRVIENAKLTEDEVYALFVVSLFGPLRYRENLSYIKILRLLNIDSESFIDICHDLNEKELIDLYQDTLAKVSDQSLGNYILEYVLIEKRTVSVSDLLKICFPEFKNKLIYALNTIMRLFYSKEAMKYLEKQINIAWNDADDDQQSDYLHCFYSFNEEKSLKILKQRVDNTQPVKADISFADIEK